MNLEAILEELKTLPPAGLERAADYIHRLHSASRAERKAALLSTAGSLTDEEAFDRKHQIEEGCENVDERRGSFKQIWRLKSNIFAHHVLMVSRTLHPPSPSRDTKE